LRDTLIYVLTRNITFNLPADLIKQAKIYAAEQDTTVNALVKNLLVEKISGDEGTKTAGRRLLKLARTGPSSKVSPRSFKREELYDRW